MDYLRAGRGRVKTRSPRYCGNSDDLPACGATVIVGNGGEDDGEVFTSDGHGGAVVIHKDVLIPWLRRAGMLDSNA